MKAEKKPSARYLPIRDYRHPESNNRVGIVAVSHRAQASYYQAIHAELARRTANGATVYYEYTRHPTSEELAQASPEARRSLEKIKELGQLSDGIFDKIGLAYQLTALPAEAGWENHDASLLDVAERVGKKALRRQVIMTKIAVSAINNSTSPEKRRDLILNLYGSSDKALSGPPKRRLARLLGMDMMPTIVDYRNDIALGAVDRHFEAVPGSELALIWGVGHLAGLGAGLEERGYEQVSEQMILALDGAAVQSV